MDLTTEPPRWTHETRLISDHEAGAAKFWVRIVDGLMNLRWERSGHLVRPRPHGSAPSAALTIPSGHLVRTSPLYLSPPTYFYLLIVPHLQEIHSISSAPKLRHVQIMRVRSNNIWVMPKCVSAPECCSADSLHWYFDVCQGLKKGEHALTIFLLEAYVLILCTVAINQIGWK